MPAAGCEGLSRGVVDERVPRVGSADVGADGTTVALRVLRSVGEIICLGQPRIIALRREGDGRPAVPAADTFRGQPAGGGRIFLRLLAHELPEPRDILFE